MKTSWRTFALVAVLGVSALLLAETSAHAQFRRPVVVAPVPVVRPVVPRAFVATPPPVVPYVNSYTYLPNGMNLNQAAALNTLAIEAQIYNSLYAPYYMPRYTTYSSYTTVTTPYYNPYGPAPLYNPYFAAFGLYR